MRFYPLFCKSIINPTFILVPYFRSTICVTVPKWRVFDAPAWFMYACNTLQVLEWNETDQNDPPSPSHPPPPTPKSGRLGLWMMGRRDPRLDCVSRFKGCQLTDFNKTLTSRWKKLLFIKKHHVGSLKSTRLITACWNPPRRLKSNRLCDQKWRFALLCYSPILFETLGYLLVKLRNLVFWLHLRIN